MGVTPTRILANPPRRLCDDVGETRLSALTREPFPAPFTRVETGFGNPKNFAYAELVESPTGEYDIRMDSFAPSGNQSQIASRGRIPSAGWYLSPAVLIKFVSLGQQFQTKRSLDDFWIDQFEVTNREYQEFVAAGGYEDPKYWTSTVYGNCSVRRRQARTRNLHEIPWAEAMSRFKDQTGFPGPSGWKNQTYPPGEEDHPVTGVSWYEASAYATFRGKSLPTVAQWEKAARDGKFTVLWGSYKPWGLTGLNENLKDRANVNSAGTVPVGSYPFGMSVYGCHDMCGNATEWCSNPCSEGFATSGGSFREGPHLFGAIGRYPGFYRADTHGFRCVKLVQPVSNDQGAMSDSRPRQAEDFKPVSEDRYRQMLTHYDYDKKPLEAEIIETKETKDWRRLKIRYVGAKGQHTEKPLPLKDRALAYLWLPKNSRCRPIRSSFTSREGPLMRD